MTGRTSTFTEGVAEIICTQTADGASLSQICQEDGMPHPATVYRWLEANESFRENYRRAREVQAHRWAAEIIAIADTATCADDAAAVRVKMDARKWTVSRMLPKVYGDRITQEHTGPDGGPVATITRVVVDAPQNRDPKGV